MLTIDQAMNPLLFASKHISVHPSSLKFFLLFTTQELREKRERERECDSRGHMHGDIDPMNARVIRRIIYATA